MGQPAAEYVNPAMLSPWARNPRKNDPAVPAAMESIKRFGWGAPVLARHLPDGSTEIIAGHTRIKAAVRLNLAEVPVRWMDHLSDSEAHALALADNKIGELAEWDVPELAAILRDLEADGEPLDGLGWDKAELDALLGTGAPMDEGDPDDVPAVDEGTPDSVPGVVYQLGPHRLLCGDCRNPEDVARLFGGERMNVAITSPPYASQRLYDEASDFKPIPEDGYVEWFEPVQRCFRDHLADDGSWFVNIRASAEGGQRHLYVYDLAVAHVREWRWLLIDDFVWVKQGLPGTYAGRFKDGWEPIFHFAKCQASGIKHRPAQVLHDSAHAFGYADADRTPVTTGNVGFRGAVKSAGQALPSNVIDVPQNRGSVGHPAAFGVALPDFFIRAYTDEGDRVFDPFMGSGTTLIAAARAGRVAYGTEISPKYCDVIRRRWTKFAKENGADPGEGALA